MTQADKDSKIKEKDKKGGEEMTQADKDSKIKEKDKKGGEEMTHADVDFPLPSQPENAINRVPT